ncbi:hypothetical protein B9G55_16620 [Saccharibacillus sp. O16]|nr:hypothetical protein B9G55_16620 [Saccharibacillus sp. O16]
MKKSAQMMSLASALLLTFALSACGTAKAPAPAPGDVPTNTTQEPPAPAADNEETTDTEHEAISATGTYNGQADPHTIEVEMDGKATSFQLSESAETQLEGLNEGDMISFEYVEHPVEGSDTPQLEIQSLEKTGGETSAGAPSGEDETAVSERPATETIEMMGDGMPDKREAKLQQGEGYSLYVFDAYTFDAAKNKLFLTAYPEYYVEIEKLPSDFNLDELRKEGQEELKKYGEVKEYAGDQLVEGPMYDARLVLQASDDKGGLYEYAVWEPEGENGYIFHIHSPSGEPSETFLTPALTSVKTIKADAAAAGK